MDIDGSEDKEKKDVKDLDEEKVRDAKEAGLDSRPSKRIWI